MTLGVIGFDFFGTLVEAKAEVTVCIGNICRKLNLHDINVSPEEFVRTYRETTATFRTVRQDDHKEVNNAVWLQATLQKLGYPLEVTSQPIIEAVESYFSPWVLRVYDDVTQALPSIRSKYRCGLISNFTHAPFVYNALHALKLYQYFECTIVSDDIGWRKPHPFIFTKFLETMNVQAKDVLFVGDEYQRDIRGAHNIGMKTAWLIRDPAKTKPEDGDISPDYTIHSLLELKDIL